LSRAQKLREKLNRRPKDMTFDEVETLMKSYGFTLSNKGKTSGSRVAFSCPGKPNHYMHIPHPEKTLKMYAIDNLIKFLEENEIE